LEKSVLGLLPLGFNDMMHGYFRALCVGYALYAVGNTVMMILLYFTDYRGALVSAAAFAVLTTVLSAVGQLLPATLYGFGFLLGSSVFLLLAVVRLDMYTGNLPYHVLGEQPMVARHREGRFARLGRRLELWDGRLTRAMRGGRRK